MAVGGTKIYCPGCNSFAVCKAISPTNIGEPKSQRWARTDYKDIAWFRRGRKCLRCGHQFLTAEVEEAFIEELVELRRRVAAKQKSVINKLKRSTPWIKRNETIPLEVARSFIRSTAWWIGHPSGPVHAPKHADRIYKSHHGWAIDFGANTFLVGKAIERCRNKINDFFDLAAKGQLPTRSEVNTALKHQVSGAVANIDGYEYSGYYPIDSRDLVFGTQSIDVEDAAKFMIRESGIEELLIDT
jgi:hypothetical protein